MQPEAIKHKIEAELADFISDVDAGYSLRTLSPVLLDSIKDFVLRKGKRVRPVLFVLGYLGFAKKQAAGLYKSALAVELLHDFMLVHDDIIDKSEMRRGKPSLHTWLNRYVKARGALRLSGQDLAIVVGDILYALAVQAFLSIGEDPRRKERALQRFIQASVFTGTGEFNELMNGLTDIKSLSKEEIYGAYDLKSACYTFSLPLTAGAVLAGARPQQVDRLFNYGLYIGRSFQINDDIAEICENGNRGRRSLPEDLKEAKKTILMWFAYHGANGADKRILRKILEKEKICRPDIREMQRILSASCAVEQARREVAAFTDRARRLLAATTMKQGYKDSLWSYSRHILSLS